MRLVATSVSLDRPSDTIHLTALSACEGCEGVMPTEVVVSGCGRFAGITDEDGGDPS